MLTSRLPILVQMALFHSFLWPSNILLNIARPPPCWPLRSLAILGSRGLSQPTQQSLSTVRQWLLFLESPGAMVKTSGAFDGSVLTLYRSHPNYSVFKYVGINALKDRRWLEFKYTVT